jgi:uncharacterized damage-inducible protein DinB
VITPDFLNTMAAYNTEMNRRVYDAAARLSEEERRRERGAFWGSIHGTLNHILWGDTMWMSRFNGWDQPAQKLAQSAEMHEDFFALRTARAEADRRISDWAGRVAPGWLSGDLTWFSGVLGNEISKPKALLAVHFFNHQTHHRGQVHAMLTAAGEKTGDTDLPFIL